MAQFDLHRNIGRLKDSSPFVVIAQSRLFEDHCRRVVIPLVRKVGLGHIPDERLKGEAIVAALNELLSRAHG